MFYLVVWTVSNKSNINYLVTEEGKLAGQLDELQKKEKNPKIKLYEIESVKYKIIYEDRVEKVVKKRPIIEVTDKKGVKRTH